MKKYILSTLILLIFVCLGTNFNIPESYQITESRENYFASEKTEAYLPALTKEQFEANNLKYSNQKKFYFGLEVTAECDGVGIEGATYAVLDKTGKSVVADIYGQAATGKTDMDGKWYVMLPGNMDYVVRQISIDEKYDIYKGKVEVNNEKISIAENGDDLSERNIINFLAVKFDNELGDEELATLRIIEEEKKRITDWKNGVEQEIVEIYESIDMLKHNDQEKDALASIMITEKSLLNDVYEQYIELADKTIREGRRSELKYDLGPYQNRLSKIYGHWEHWLILFLIVISGLLHFFFNWHMRINLIDILGVCILSLDICLYSVIFLGILVIFNMIMTYIGSMNDNDIEDVKEDVI